MSSNWWVSLKSCWSKYCKANIINSFLLTFSVFFLFINWSYFCLACLICICLPCSLRVSLFLVHSYSIYILLFRKGAVLYMMVFSFYYQSTLWMQQADINFSAENCCSSRWGGTWGWCSKWSRPRGWKVLYRFSNSLEVCNFIWFLISGKNQWHGLCRWD